jgi:cold shock CspA family protein
MRTAELSRRRSGELSGFASSEGGLLYFHRNAILIGDFDKLRRGDEVYYIEDVGDTGPMATKVWVKGE